MEKIEFKPAENINLEETFSDVFKTSTSGTGEEELLRIASQYSLQITAKQIRLLLYLEWTADEYENSESETKKIMAIKLRNFVKRWLELKQNNNSDMFVMKALEFISLRRFLNENSFKVDIKK